jgi:hypothetical protein
VKCRILATADNIIDFYTIKQLSLIINIKHNGNYTWARCLGYILYLSNSNNRLTYSLTNFKLIKTIERKDLNIEIVKLIVIKLSRQINPQIKKFILGLETLLDN